MDMTRHVDTGDTLLAIDVKFIIGRIVSDIINAYIISILYINTLSHNLTFYLSDILQRY